MKFEFNKNITFIDLFAGIGGIRLGMERAGFKCIYSCEIDPHACKMYEANFNDNPQGDITKINPIDLPDFDILCAGFPCQSFSISGHQKGFNDVRGSLFFDICRIIEFKKPKVVFLENVKNLIIHDSSNTFKIIQNKLIELGYAVSFKVLNAKDFGVPQNRERVIIIGTLNKTIFDFSKLKLDRVESMELYLDKKGDFEYLESDSYTILDNPKVQSKSGLIFSGYLNKKTRTIGVRPNTIHLSRAHKQPNRIYSTKGIHPTLSSQEISGRYFIYNGNSVRKLTIDECFRFMGFPDDFIKLGLLSKLYLRIGNSVCVNMIEQVAIEIMNQMEDSYKVIQAKEKMNTL
jgi:DNA (cytosine-5)-methyltransferase 1